MRPTRTVALAGLVLVAVVAPISAFALTAAPDHHPGTPPGPQASDTHAVGPETDEPGDEPSEAVEPADDPTDSSSPAPASAAGAAGRAHAVSMQAWAHCVAAAASGPKTGVRSGPAKLACGDKPVGPGRAAHAPAPGTQSPSTPHGSNKPHGKSGAHRH